MKYIFGQTPFTNYKIFGPYFHNSIQRHCMHLVPIDENGKRQTMTVARYKMCLKEKRLLKTKEEVDHINDNGLDDRIENLQILSKKENQEKDNKRRNSQYVKLQCPICNKIFIREKRQTSTVKKTNTATTCSRECGAKNKGKIKQSIIIEEFTVNCVGNI